MFPLFTNFALLAGLAAIAAPIIIHLLLKRKSQRLRFSTVQFFLKQDEQSMRRRKLRNLLLLATRVLLFALIVLGFTRPFLQGGGGTDGANRKQLVILLDTSASMQAATPQGTQWARAKQLAQQELAKLQKDDRVALVSCSTRAELISEFAPPATVLKKMESLEPNFGTAKIDEGLRQVAKVLPTANPELKVELCIISDLQRSACDNIGDTPLPRELVVRTIDLGERFIPNIAVNALQLETTDEAGPHALLTSFSDENAEIPYKLKIDGKDVFAGTIHLGSGSTTNLPLAIPALAPGWHSAEFSVEAKDALHADNIAYATIHVPPPIHGLIVEPRPSEQIFLQESYFVATALNPVRSADQTSPSRFTYEKISIESLPEKLQRKPGQPAVQFVILPAARTLPGATSSALNDYVRNGGGLMLFLGEDASAINYSSLSGLLPAQPGRMDGAGETGWHITTYEKSSAMFAVFREPNSGNLFLPEFLHRQAIIPSEGSTVLAEFEDGVPLIVARQIGQGRVVLVNTSANTSWTDWQKHKTFVPWLHASTLYLSKNDAAHERAIVPAFVSDTEVELDLAAANQNPTKKQILKLQRVGGPEVSFATDDDGVAQDLLLQTPGIYILKAENGREIRRLAANLPTVESDLSTLAPTDVEGQFVRAGDTQAQVLRAGLFGDPTRGKELWRLLLLAALVILLFEPLLANRMFA